jgi:hypothetical protein
VSDILPEGYPPGGARRAKLDKLNISRCLSVVGLVLLHHSIISANASAHISQPISLTSATTNSSSTHQPTTQHLPSTLATIKNNNLYLNTTTTNTANMPGRSTRSSSYYYAPSGSSYTYSSDSSSGSGSSPASASYQLGGGYSSRGSNLKWQCCRCSDGWFSTAIDAYCPSCHCARCSNCRYAQ